MFDVQEFVLCLPCILQQVSVTIAKCSFFSLNMSISDVSFLARDRALESEKFNSFFFLEFCVKESFVLFVLIVFSEEIEICSGFKLSSSKMLSCLNSSVSGSTRQCASDEVPGILWSIVGADVSSPLNLSSSW